MSCFTKIKNHVKKMDDLEEKQYKTNCDVYFHNVSLAMAEAMKKQLEYLESLSPRGAFCEIKEVGWFDDAIGNES